MMQNGNKIDSVEPSLTVLKPCWLKYTHDLGVHKIHFEYNITSAASNANCFKFKVQFLVTINKKPILLNDSELS